MYKTEINNNDTDENPSISESDDINSVIKSAENIKLKEINEYDNYRFTIFLYTNKNVIDIEIGQNKVLFAGRAYSIKGHNPIYDSIKDFVNKEDGNR